MGQKWSDEVATNGRHHSLAFDCFVLRFALCSGVATATVSAYIYFNIHRYRKTPQRIYTKTFGYTDFIIVYH